MPILKHPLPRGLLSALATLSVLLLAGCASDEGPRGRPPAQAAKPPPPLLGSASFFEERIQVELKVGAGVGFGGEFKGEAGERGQGRSQGGGGHVSMGGSLGGMRYGSGGSRHGGEGGESRGGPREEAGERPTGPGGSPSTLPPVMIHLLVTNRSQEHLTLAIIDFLSPLGNFVINPERLSLDPGQSVEVEPMTSRLDNALDAADVTLALHLPGRTERKTVTLHAAPAPAAPEGGPRPLP
jgi:hypothetical protein